MHALGRLYWFSRNIVWWLIPLFLWCWSQLPKSFSEKKKKEKLRIFNSSFFFMLITSKFKDFLFHGFYFRYVRALVKVSFLILLSSFWYHFCFPFYNSSSSSSSSSAILQKFSHFSSRTGIQFSPIIQALLYKYTPF